MSIALYRRYRPDTFQDVIGQDHVVKPLMAALRSGRVSHAYLFSGPRGCGKTTSARIMARCLNCAEGPTDTPCGKCESCKDLATGGSGSLDVVEIDAASHNGVDDARELRERAGFAPVRDRFKIFILDEAHMVTQQGFNALLKIVEEPPEHVKFIFATTEPDKVIGTIRSRTHHYPFRLVPPEVMEKYMEKLCQAENIEPAAGVLQLVMRAGAGSVRDSLSVLDQLMAGAEDGKLAYGTASALLGYTDSAILERSVDAIIDRDGAALFEVIAKMVEGGHEPRRYLEDLLLRLRDLLVLSVSSVEDAQVALAGTPRDQLKVMSAQAERWGTAGISRASDLTNTALTELTGATAPRIQVELLAARLLLPPPAEQVTSGVNAGKSPGNPKSLSGAEAAMAALHRASRPRSNPAPAAPLASAPPRHSSPDLSVGQVDEIKTAEVAAAPTNSGETPELSAPRPPLKKAEEKSLSDGGYQHAGDTSATLTPIKSPVSKRAAVAKGEQYWQ
ncbi:DNA polymerase III subunit gamma and tau, partial [Varibaculum sp.]|uniref:DNA polymerase III subunit gamma and tau n=1 Tax=Varibaculum sp. TaxID=1895474 RepID=UPI002601109C